MLASSAYQLNVTLRRVLSSLAKFETNRITLASCAYQVNVKRNGAMGVLVMRHLKTNKTSYLNWELRLQAALIR